MHWIYCILALNHRYTSIDMSVCKYVDRVHIMTTQLSWYIDGLVQECSTSSALAWEILQSCTKPSISKWPQTIHCSRLSVRNVGWWFRICGIKILLDWHTQCQTRQLSTSQKEAWSLSDISVWSDLVEQCTLAWDLDISETLALYYMV